MRKWFAALLVLALPALAAPRAEAFKGTVTIALSGEPLSFDPHIQSEFIGTMIWPWGYDNLMYAEAGTGKLRPWLAEKLERATAQQFKFTLRNGAVFTDGTPVTSAAVKYSLGRIFDPKIKSRLRPYFKDIKEVEILDGRTFIIHTKVPMNGLPNLLRRWGAIMNPKTKDIDLPTISRSTFGSGPYVLKQWTKGQKMVFEVNPRWWNNANYPNRPKTLILRRIQEHATRVKALLANEVDIITGVPAHFVLQIQQNPDLEVINIPAVRILYVGFFTGHGGPFANLKVRQAVAHAVNTDSIIKTLLGGYADPYFQMLHPWVYSGYNPKMNWWYNFDLGKARQLMKEAGFEKGFKAHLFSPTGRYPADKETCQAISGMVKQVGVEAPCRPVNFPLFRKTFTAYQSGRTKGAAFFYQGYGNGAGDTAVSIRGTSACKGAWSPHCFPELDKLTDDAIATADPEEQQAAFEKVSLWMRDHVTQKPVAKIHELFGVNKKRVSFVPRHDEALDAWGVAVK